jgi:hypothetical protein
MTSPLLIGHVFICCPAYALKQVLFPVSAPTKRRTQSGSTSAASLLGLESPCSSRASVAGSNTSDVWSTASGSTVRRGGGSTGLVIGSNGVLSRGGPMGNGGHSAASYADFFDDDDIGEVCF